jgi:hypothetical protein
MADSESLSSEDTEEMIRLEGDIRGILEDVPDDIAVAVLVNLVARVIVSDVERDGDDKGQAIAWFTEQIKLTVDAHLGIEGTRIQ